MERIFGALSFEAWTWDEVIGGHKAQFTKNFAC